MEGIIKLYADRTIIKPVSIIKPQSLYISLFSVCYYRIPKTR